jgi:hypothetical protein
LRRWGVSKDGAITTIMWFDQIAAYPDGPAIASR